jgi:hypothetical protein
VFIRRSIRLETQEVEEVQNCSGPSRRTVAH